MNRSFFTFTLAFLLAIGLSDSASANKQKPAPDVGVPDQQLASLGTGAASFLIERLHDVKNEKYFEGAVDRLKAMGLKSAPDERILLALQSFVEINSQREQVPFQTVMAMYEALGAMGYVGGPPGVDYLIEWVQTGKYAKKVRCHYGKRDIEYTASILRDGAVWGLGLSGDSKALKVLEDLATIRSDVPYKGSYLGVLQDAIKENKNLQKTGVQATLLKRWKRRVEGQKKER